DRGSSLPARQAAPTTGARVVETSGVRHARSQLQLLQGNQTRFQGVNGGLCPVPDTDDLVDLLHVVPDGLHTQVHFLCDLGVLQATRDTAENGEVASLQTNIGCVHFSSTLKIRRTSSRSWTEFDALCFRYFLLSLRFSFSASLRASDSSSMASCSARIFATAVSPPACGEIPRASATLSNRRASCR